MFGTHHHERSFARLDLELDVRTCLVLEGSEYDQRMPMLLIMIHLWKQGNNIKRAQVKLNTCIAKSKKSKSRVFFIYQLVEL